MTEKRFTLVKCYNEQWGVVDKSLEEIDQLVLITTSKSGTGYLVNELNKLFDENEQLKHDATVLICSNQEYRKENEQLKQENQELHKLNQEYIDSLSDEKKETLSEMLNAILGDDTI